ncbi:hypothetical protein DL764_007847 [Monosporascus ibericus]|uniref:pectin lyase n=1 Tax=Monosporascus ibericus TaxID=155417 RepID=A0A4Q4T158_9PEZI|nr:hypothetical protein DL764_007847 [Monosporascus ibericus]
MKFSSSIAFVAAALLSSVSALPSSLQPRAVVYGAAEGFAKGVTGGGSASPVTPRTTDELIKYLGDSSPRVIVLDREFDFTGTEGTEVGSGCSPWGTASGCQIAINKNGWCDNYQPNAPKVSRISYDKAGVLGITVASDKTLVGLGSKGVIKGKGLRMVNGVKNIIIQNVHITNLNPQFVWGGDAITIDGADMVWIDHVKTSLIGRQHIVLGNGPSNRVTISNSEIDGRTNWSATCDGNHYWGMYFTGSNDMVTLKGNFIHHTTGRSPKVAGNTLLHAVNNYFISSPGHNFEISAGGKVLAEGNVFTDASAPVESGMTGQLFTADNGSACRAVLGRNCAGNTLNNSGAFRGSSTDFLQNFAGKNIASASSSSQVDVTHVGFGRI